ncbi:MAG: hypothetical protein AAFY19_06980, partial [Pseudomonadota bacterium]
PNSSHNNLSQSPSQQAARTDSVIAWFNKYRTQDGDDQGIEPSAPATMEPVGSSVGASAD